MNFSSKEMFLIIIAMFFSTFLAHIFFGEKECDHSDLTEKIMLIEESLLKLQERDSITDENFKLTISEIQRLHKINKAQFDQFQQTNIRLNYLEEITN